MRLIALISVCSLSLLTGCLSTQPPAPKVPRCQIVAVKGGSPYVYCKMPDGSAQRIPISSLPSRPEKYICTTDAGYADGINYQRALSRFIDTHCQ